MDTVSSSFVGLTLSDYMIVIVCKGMKEIAAIYKILIYLMWGLSQPYLYKFNIPYVKCLRPGISFFFSSLAVFTCTQPKGNFEEQF